MVTERVLKSVPSDIKCFSHIYWTIGPLNVLTILNKSLYLHVEMTSEMGTTVYICPAATLKITKLSSSKDVVWLIIVIFLSFY